MTPEQLWIRVIRNHFFMRGYWISLEYAKLLAQNKFKLTMPVGQIIQVGKFVMENDTK